MAPRGRRLTIITHHLVPETEVSGAIPTCARDRSEWCHTYVYNLPYLQGVHRAQLNLVTVVLQNQPTLRNLPNILSFKLKAMK
jgi:hypothetical protein